MRVPEPTYKDYYNLLNPAQGVFVPDNLRYPLDKRQKKSKVSSQYHPYRELCQLYNLAMGQSDAVAGIQQGCWVYL